MKTALRRIRPVVLAFGGTDPSGGAGLCADIQAISSLGCHPAPVVTTITVQDTHNVNYHTPISAEIVMDQALAVLQDLPVKAFKLGLLGSVENALAICELLSHHSHIPVILDPIINAGGGLLLTDDPMCTIIKNQLLPLTTIITPNTLEAQKLTGIQGDVEHCAQKLLTMGARSVLVTGGHDDSKQIINHYYDQQKEHKRFRWERLPGEYHGSGCTLASAIAAGLALGIPMLRTIATAQMYTFHCLKNGGPVGNGQDLPDRLYWGQVSLQLQDSI